MTRRPAAPRPFPPSSPFYGRPEPVVEQYAVGDRVTHDAHGLGRVVGEEDDAVIVQFGPEHVRVRSPYSKLTKL